MLELPRTDLLIRLFYNIKIMFFLRQTVHLGTLKHLQAPCTRNASALRSAFTMGILSVCDSIMIYRFPLRIRGSWYQDTKIWRYLSPLYTMTHTISPLVSTDAEPRDKSVLVNATLFTLYKDKVFRHRKYHFWFSFLVKSVSVWQLPPLGSVFHKLWVYIVGVGSYLCHLTFQGPGNQQTTTIKKKKRENSTPPPPSKKTNYCSLSNSWNCSLGLNHNE